MTPQPHKIKNIWTLVISILFIAMGFYIVVESGDNMLMRYGGWAGIAFFTTLALFSIVSLVKKSR
ncbi:MAG: hypothetical protein ACO1N9_04260 [Flavobacterium sp.]